MGPGTAVQETEAAGVESVVAPENSLCCYAWHEYSQDSSVGDTPWWEPSPGTAAANMPAADMSLVVAEACMTAAACPGRAIGCSATSEATLEAGIVGTAGQAGPGTCVADAVHGWGRRDC